MQEQIGALLAQGRSDEAIDQCHQWLGRQPGNPQAMAMLGSACCQKGELAEGVEWLRRALKSQPGLIPAQVDLGRALRQRGQPAEAISWLNRADKAAPNQPGIVNELALALRAAGRPADAARALRTTLKRHPGHPGLSANLGNALREAGRADEALEIFQPLIDAGAPDAALRNSYALALAASGRHEDAEAQFRLALDTAGDEPRAGILANLASCLGQAGRWTEALKSFEAASAATPRDPELVNLRANALRELGRIGEAADLLQTATTDHPGHVHGWRNRAALLEESNQESDALKVAEEGLGHHAGDPMLTILAARCERRLNQDEAARQRLDALQDAKLAPDLRRRKWLELAQLLDRAGGYKDAFKFYRKAADLQRKALPKLPENRYDRWLDRLLAAEPHAMTDPAAGTVETPVFVVGFPRSGTTLLDQFLDGHSRLRTVEESDALEQLVETLEADGMDYPAALSDLSDDRAEALRAVYWSRLTGGNKAGPEVRWIDRMPMNLLHLGLIHRLWPQAPLVFLQRHPADLALSAFMQDFRVNALSVHFLRLKDTADFLARVFQAWRRWAPVHADRTKTLRYEDLVDDAESALRSLTTFLGLEFEPAMLDHVTTARARTEIRTVSYQQASQPLYASSRYRWRNYQKQLEPVANILAAEAAAQGYEFE